MDMTDEETKANWIAQKLVHHIEKINKDGWLAQSWSAMPSPTRPATARRRAGSHRKSTAARSIFATACAARTLDLLLEDIGKLKRFANTIATVRVIGKVISNHAAIRHEYKTCCSMCGLGWPRRTRKL